MAVQSHWFSVGSIVPWARAGVGAVATQANVEASYGPRGLELMAAGTGAPEALASLLKEDPKAEFRQVAMVDWNGRAAAHTGEKCMAAAGHVVGDGFSCQGNIMESRRVWESMSRAFRSSARMPLQDRLMRSLDAGQEGGGDLRGKQSAAMVVVGPEASPNPWEGKIIDLRVEDSPDPLKELKRLIGYNVGYNWMNKGDELLSSGKLGEASEAYSAGRRFIPRVLEAKYWVAVGLLISGKDRRKGVRMLKEVCAEEKNWVQVTRGLANSGIKIDQSLLREVIP